MQNCRICMRTIHSTAVQNGKHNMRKFPTFGNQGSKKHRKGLAEGMYPELENLMRRGVQEPYLKENGIKVFVPEMVPELIVPDLTECKMKPYVSYRAPEIERAEFTAQDLFHAVYTEKIVKDFKEGKLNEDGNPTDPSEEEMMSGEEAKLRMQQTGSDLVWKGLEDPHQLTV